MMEFVLSEIFRKTISNLVPLIGDNVATSKALDFQLGCVFVDCASHGFNFAVKDLVSGYRLVVCLVHSVMDTLRSLKISAKLRKYTLLRANIEFTTSWRSTFCMLKRYPQVWEKLPEIDIRESSILLLFAAEKNELNHICDLYGELESVS